MTDQQQLETAVHGELAHERARTRAVFESIPQGLLIVDERGTIIDANSEAMRLFGGGGRLLGTRLHTVLVAGENDNAAAPLLDADWLTHVALQPRWTMDAVQFRPKGMNPFRAHCSITSFTTGAVVLITDTSDAETERAELEWQATHDALTGLGSRALVTDRLQHAMDLATRSGLWPALLYLDLDSFKSVNDQLGHATGDRLLIEAARRLEQSVRSVDTVARLGGDEFVVLFESLERPDIAEQVAARILLAMQEPFDFNGESVSVSASIGIARADAGCRGPDQLMEHAELAMYRGKENGRNRIETFDAGMHAQSRRRVDIERALRLALDNDELTVVYQPIFNTQEGALVAFEALVRWTSAELGVIGPTEFIPLAEQTGLIGAVGERVLDIACRDAASWRAMAHFPIGLHVNVSGPQLGASNFVSFLARVSKHHRIDPSTLTLELTESVLLENPERAAMRFMALHELGIRVAVDDFGVGYSSTASLRRFMIDVLKVDRQFVAGIAQSPEGQRVLQEILVTAGADYQIIAEGVEQPEELVSLRELGFQLAQGYLLAAPMPPAEALLLAAASSIPLEERIDQ
jgi:diguanylate cyclase (GGDEF)-like protein